MKHPISHLIPLALVAALGTSSAVAQSYAGIALGKRGTQEWRDGSGTVREPRERDLPVTLYGGWRFTDTWALEAGVARLAKAAFATSEGRIASHSSAVYLAAKATFPVDDKLAWFLKGGAARNFMRVEFPDGTEHTAHKLRPMAGAGIEYRFTPHVSVVGEFAAYGRISTPKATMRHNVLQAGARFDF